MVTISPVFLWCRLAKRQVFGKLLLIFCTEPQRSWHIQLCRPWRWWVSTNIQHNIPASTLQRHGSKTARRIQLQVTEHEHWIKCTYRKKMIRHMINGTKLIKHEQNWHQFINIIHWELILCPAFLLYNTRSLKTNHFHPKLWRDPVIPFTFLPN